ncbi:DUF1772 domain-containing protein [Balneola sp. MJW-20]|uniref:anthrone oxygenase family protein n=1 Tax=Gracilimonas aurantiaca TaxID=3234185 RepID=UPI0034654924
MELTLNSIILFIAILLTGLSAGLFYAWQVSVIPGTQLASDTTYLETMQHINRAIINPFFMLIFLGSLVAQVACVFVFRENPTVFWLLLTATLFYGATVGITGAGNVPLNDELDKVELSTLSTEQEHSIRVDYEKPWNRLHLIRTIFSVLSFMLLLIAALTLG